MMTQSYGWNQQRLQHSQNNNKIGYSETRTVSAQSVLNTYSNAAVHTGVLELEFSSVQVL